MPVLVLLAWANTASNAGGQTFVTNGCLVITCPPNGTNYTCSDTKYFNSHGIGVTNQCSDGVAPSFEVQCQPPLETSLALGVHSVTCSVVAAGAVIANCEFLITVEPRNPPPIVIECPTREFSVDIPCYQNSAQVTYTLPTVTNGTLIHCYPPSGDTFPVGTTWVDCRGINDCGVRVGCGIKVIVTRGSRDSLF